MADFKKIARNVAEAPARALDKTIRIIAKDANALFHKKPFRLTEEYIDILGPGLVTEPLTMTLQESPLTHKPERNTGFS